MAKVTGEKRTVKNVTKESSLCHLTSVIIVLSEKGAEMRVKM